MKYWQSAILVSFGAYLLKYLADEGFRLSCLDIIPFQIHLNMEWYQNRLPKAAILRCETKRKNKINS